MILVIASYRGYNQEGDRIYLFNKQLLKVTMYQAPGIEWQNREASSIVGAYILVGGRGMRGDQQERKEQG